MGLLVPDAGRPAGDPDRLRALHRGVLARLSDRSGPLVRKAPGAITEFSSALSFKVRTGQLDADLRNRVCAAFLQMLGASFDVLPVSVAAFTAAAAFARQHAIGLRAGDALHLAVAAEHGAVLVSLDRRLVEAGSALGVATRLL